MSEGFDLAAWLREKCAGYVFDVAGVLNRPGGDIWPLHAPSFSDLETKLIASEHLLPLPREPAALANILEVLVVDYILDELREVDGVLATRGTERGYPDLELSGSALAHEFWAVDVKVAQRQRLVRGEPRRTQSRITLYTGNTYFKHPKLHWPGTFRPFGDYAGHIDVLILYTLNLAQHGRADQLELIVQEPWRIASKERSSGTREYIGAVMEIDRLRGGNGEFKSREEFYSYWRKYKFKTSPGIAATYARLIEKLKTPK